MSRFPSGLVPSVLMPFLCAVATPAVADLYLMWEQYQNERFGFSIQYPRSIFNITQQALNGDGISSSVSSPAATLAIWGTKNAMNYTSPYQSACDGGCTNETYHVSKTQNLSAEHQVVTNGGQVQGITITGGQGVFKDLSGGRAGGYAITDHFQGRLFTNTWEGEVLTYELSQASLDKLNTSAKAIFAAFPQASQS